MKKIVTLLAAGILLASCSKDHTSSQGSATTKTNKVLMLKVDLLTSTFEGGTELTFASQTPTFTITSQYDPPLDFGSVQLSYSELNEPLFDGSIMWMGTGHMSFPQELLPASQFDEVAATDTIYPAAGFENVFNPYNNTYDYSPVWLAVQRLTVVREYLSSNPSASVKLFLYTPSVGLGNPAEWDWIIYLKN